MQTDAPLVWTTQLHFDAAAQQAAATRGGQITAAQQGLAGAYNGQGQMNLSTYGISLRGLHLRMSLREARAARRSQAPAARLARAQPPRACVAAAAHEHAPRERYRAACSGRGRD